MNIRWEITIVRDDQTQDTYPIKPKQIVAFERHFKIGLSAAFTKEQKQEHVYWLAWEAERIHKGGVKPFDSWLDNIDEVSLATVNAPLDETA